MAYVFSVLRSTDPARCGGACVDEILEEHRRVAEEACRRLGAKQYLARQPLRAHWRDHFGAGWDQFVARKARPLRPQARAWAGPGDLPQDGDDDGLRRRELVVVDASDGVGGRAHSLT